MSTATAKQIRQALKDEMGLTSKQVSVRTDNYSLGSSVHVTVKVRGVHIDTVREIARRFEDVRRCEATGEILNGGNTYVNIARGGACQAEWIGLMRWLSTLPDDGTMLEPVPGLRVSRVASGDLAMWDDAEARSGQFYGPHAIAAAIQDAAAAAKTKPHLRLFLKSA